MGITSDRYDLLDPISQIVVEKLVLIPYRRITAMEALVEEHSPTHLKIPQSYIKATPEIQWSRDQVEYQSGYKFRILLGIIRESRNRLIMDIPPLRTIIRTIFTVWKLVQPHTQSPNLGK